MLNAYQHSLLYRFQFHSSPNNANKKNRLDNMHLSLFTCSLSVCEYTLKPDQCWKKKALNNKSSRKLCSKLQRKKKFSKTCKQNVSETQRFYKYFLHNEKYQKKNELLAFRNGRRNFYQFEEEVKCQHTPSSQQKKNSREQR